MFRNRALEMKVVKTKKGNMPVESVTIEQTFEHKAEVIGDVIEKSVKKIGLALCAYVVLDTVRKVLIESAKG